MLKLTALLITSFISTSTFAAENSIRCNIENPCGWSEPAPGDGKAQVDYCVGTLEGSTKELKLTLVDREGLIFEEIKMAPSIASDGTITATDADQRFSLNASVITEGPVGTLDDNSANVGYFATCEKF